MAGEHMQKSAKQQTKIIATAEAVSKALDMRREGHTIREVAAALGRSPTWVHESIKAYIEEHPLPNADAYRAVVLERQEGLIATHWPLRFDPESAKVIQAADKIIVSVTGAAAPVRAELSGPNGGPVETFDLSKLTDAQLDKLARGDTSVVSGGDTCAPTMEGETGTREA